MKTSATLVFDIGKTTKKALLFDPAFEVIEEITEQFAETTDEDGFACEDLPAVTAWVQERMRTSFSHSSVRVTHMNFSAYGASLVYLDRNRKLILPFCNYLKPCPADVLEQFRQKYYREGKLCQETASPWLGFLNSGLQAFWMKHCHPAKWREVATALHLPQYFAFVGSGQLFNERTSLGCHTMLWNLQNDSYHSWVEKEGIDRLFPKVTATAGCVERKINNDLVCCGHGVHDSSAALMPYLVTRREPFLMLSTGTWNICFNPWNQSPLTKAELEKDCLSYLTFEGKPVKASRIFLGHEHELQQKELARVFSQPADAYKKVVFDQHVYEGLTGPSFEPLGMEGTGPLPEKPIRKTNYAAFTDFATAQHQLMKDLVSWQKLSLDLVDPGETIRDVIIVGGFSKSLLFLEILKREIPQRNFFLSDHPRASALGAAWLVHDQDKIGQLSGLLNIHRI